MTDLTIVIPNFNNGKYIGKCISSIFNQTVQPDLIIIVDDCSTDNSRDVILQLADLNPTLKYIFLNQNVGVSKARNIGLNNVETKYVTFLDSDDFYYNTKKLENELKLLKNSTKNGKKVLSYSVTIDVDENGSNINSFINNYWFKFQLISGDALIDLISMVKPFRLPRDYCIDKEIIDEVGAYSYYQDFYEDYDLLIRLAEYGTKFYCTYEPGTGYRHKSSGLSHKSLEMHIKTKKEIQNTYYNKLSANNKLLVKINRILVFFNHLLYKTYGILKKRFQLLSGRSFEISKYKN